MPILPDRRSPDKTSPIIELRKALRRAVDAAVGSAATFAVREETALMLTNGAVRENLEEDLQALADEYGAEVLVDGELYRQHQPGTVPYHSLCGALNVYRWTYRPVGERNGATVVPLELATGLMERGTPAMMLRIGRGHGSDGTRELEANLRSSHRVPPSRTALERMGKSLGLAVREATVRLEPIVRRAERLAPGAHSLSLGLDRTTIPMEELADPDRKSPLRNRRAPYLRKAPAPVEVNYRMAYVGTVAINDGDGNKIWSRRYSASAHEGPKRVLHRMMQDVRWMRRTRRNLPVLVVQDAAPEMWSLVVGALVAEPLVRTWHEVIDRYHFAERLTQIADALVDVDPAKLVAQWLKTLDEHDDAVDDILARVDAELKRGYIGTSRRTLNEQQTYLENNRARLRYATLVRRNFPIGSGITEAACKSVVMQRTKRSGQRWGCEGIDAVLALRTHLLNDRLEPVVQLLRRQAYTAEIRNAA